MKVNKVLFLLHLPPPVHGSSMVGSFIRNSILVNDSFDALFINLLASKHVSDSGKLNFVKIINFFKSYRELLSSLIKNKPVLCYYALTVSGLAFYRDLLFILVIKLFRINLVYHLHNKGVLENQKKCYYNLFYNFVFKNSNIILLSQRLYSDIRKFVPANKVHVCPNGIPIYSADLKTCKRNNKIVKILYLSNLIESKGVFILLEALSLLRKQGIQFNCDFVGGEGDIDTIHFNRKIIELDLMDNVSYKGKLFGNDKNLIFSQSDIFVFPTFYPMECFPLVLLEAMQHRIPIISTFEGGIPDIVEDGVNGYLVSQKNIRTLAEKIKLLILQPELRSKMGKASFEKFRSKYKLDNFETRFVEILQNIN